MRPLAWGCFGMLALGWSALAWLLHAAAGTGSVAVVRVSHWLDIDPASTQWIADTMAFAGGVAQWFILLVWAIGLGVLVVLAMLASKTIGSVNDLAQQAENTRWGRIQPDNDTISGEITDKRITKTPPNH